MKFNIEKNDLVHGLRLVEKITVQRGIQPVLANILIEAVDGRTVKFTSTDLDILIEAHIKANIKEEGSITLPAKKLLEIVSKLPDKTINFVLEVIAFLSCSGEILKSDSTLVGIVTGIPSANFIVSI